MFRSFQCAGFVLVLLNLFLSMLFFLCYCKYSYFLNFMSGLFDADMEKRSSLSCGHPVSVTLLNL